MTLFDELFQCDYIDISYFQERCYVGFLAHGRFSLRYSVVHLGDLANAIPFLPDQRYFVQWLLVLELAALLTACQSGARMENAGSLDYYYCFNKCVLNVLELHEHLTLKWPMPAGIICSDKPLGL